MGFNVAIDGPAGAGKSTIAKAVSAKLGFIYVDTGAMYRAIALYLIRNGILPEDNDGIEKNCVDAHVSIEYVDGVQVVLLNGENVNGLIRTQEVSNMASVSSANPKVREMLLDLQRKLASENDVVMDGRDIGTNILPNAQCKIYLTASSKERARRRFLELKEKGTECDIDTIEKEIIERDERDMNRETAPLKQAQDAVYVDTSEMNIDEVTKKLLEIVGEKRA